ncbi:MULTISPECIES: hypothetical protein [Gordonia]|uniref:Uncharacterized protein n=2 Tax=Gordonia TaxID=2053 RepID=L7LM43_9ACTN|nr:MULTISPECIES: hypothetical protein [Gordonia]KJR08737.1 hypothetical protein UG54_06850 [Gordonia sihwensis]KXT57411.1 hypothetical protein Y710_08230 [Gordonia sp. QH-12]MBY4569405.1 hypothetical protein [Gordonia sihwensis]GAC61811.1 hypothetical protein GSI01S_24_00080 [Gordonia sihwensis NBRC 108236]
MNAAEKAELEHLRRKLSRLSGQSGARAGTASGVVSSGVIAVPESVASLFPKRGLPRGSVAAVSGASVVPMSIIAEASRTGATVALVGLPRLNLAAAVEMGADLSRIAVVAEPGADRLEVAGVLLDGMDLVVLGFEDRLGPTGSSVAPARARVLGGRARKQSSTLLVLGDWPGTATRVQGRVREYRHLPVRRSGYGRIGGFRVEVQVSAPGARPVSDVFDLVVPGLGEEGVMRLVRPTMPKAGSGAEHGARVPAALAVAN